MTKRRKHPERRLKFVGDGGAVVHLEKERFLSKFKIQIIAVGYAIITTRGEDLDWKMRAFLSFAKCASISTHSSITPFNYEISNLKKLQG
ncbi:hypothetical protein LINPERPRIM_LOCUS9672 [Linum perenne]